MTAEATGAGDRRLISLFNLAGEVPVRPLLIGGVLLLVLGLLGEFLVFPGMLASNGSDFASQISTSGDIDIYDEYDTGDTVIIVDTIARIQYEEGKTSVWLESIGADFEDDIRFRFEGNLLSDFGPDSSVVITFEVVQYDSSEVPEGYDSSDINDRALPADAVAPRYSSPPELAFGGLAVLGLLLLAFGGYSGWRGGGDAPEDDRGAPVAPSVVVPAMAPAAAPVVVPPLAPVMAPAAAAPAATPPVTIQCPACQAQLKINDPTRPLSLSCPGCGAGMVVR